MSKPLRNKILGDEVMPSDAGYLPAHLLYTQSRSFVAYSPEDLVGECPSPKSLSDQGDSILHGELYLDKKGAAHFICHTPGDMSFVEVREALGKFIDLFLDQIERQEECPLYDGEVG